MDTSIAEAIAAIHGAVSSAELFSEAVRTNKKVKYYVLQRIKHKILIRYVTPNGNVTNGKGKRYTGFKPGAPRFTNYWHAYAYQQRLIQQKGD